MNILVTGGTGFLGSHVTRELGAWGYDPISIGSDTFDLRHPQEVEDLFDETKPDVVYHLAGDVGGIMANVATPADFWYNNLMMGLNVLEESRHHNVQKLIMVGTVCSYPKYPGIPFTEDALWDGYPEETNSAYGVAKRALLTGAQAYREQYGLNTIFLIPANLYGPGDNFEWWGGHVVADMIRKFSEDKEVVLYGDGRATRDLLYVEDAAHGIVRAAELYNGSWPVNLGTGVETEIKELAKIIAELLDFSGNIIWDDSYPDGQPCRVLDTERAKALFDWEAETPLRVGIQDTIEWYQETAEQHAKL